MQGEMFLIIQVDAKIYDKRVIFLEYWNKFHFESVQIHTSK